MYTVKHPQACVILVTFIFIWGIGRSAAQELGLAVVQTMGRAGGSLCVQNAAGDIIELTVPAGALQEDVEISMRPLTVPSSGAIADHVFDGVELLPEGLSFLTPAKLELTLAVPVADPCMVVLYHVRSEEYVVPLDWQHPVVHGDEQSSEDEEGEDGQEDANPTEEMEVVGYLGHFSSYGAGVPTPSEADALLEMAFEMIPPYDPYGYQAFEEALSDILSIEGMITRLGGDNPFAGNVEEAVLAHIKGFLKEPRPEPPCDADYIEATTAYFKIMNLFGLPVYDDPVKNQEVNVVRVQMAELFEEVANRCLTQLNLYINIDMIWAEGLEKNYSGVVNLGWQTRGDDPSYVYGTGELPTRGSGQYGAVTTTFDGVWYVVAEGAVVMAMDEAQVMTDLTLELELRGEVLEEMTSCIPSGCVSFMSPYHYEKTLELSLRQLSQTVVTVETFEGGTAITTTTLEKVEAPLRQ